MGNRCGLQICNLTSKNATSVDIWTSKSCATLLWNSVPFQSFQGQIAPGSCGRFQLNGNDFIVVPHLMHLSVIENFLRPSEFTVKIAFEKSTSDVVTISINLTCGLKILRNFQHAEVTHRVDYEQSGNGDIKIVLRDTEEETENLRRIVELSREGSSLKEAGKYQEAFQKFLEVYRTSCEYRAKISAQANLRALEADMERKAQSLNSEGVELLEKNECEAALNKFDEALTLAKEGETIQSIEFNMKIAGIGFSKKLNQDGMISVKNCQYEEALKCFERALKYVVDRYKFGLMKNNMRRTRLTKLCQLAAERFDEEGTILSQNKQHEEALKKFKKALKFANRTNRFDLIKKKMINIQQMHV